MSLNSIVDLSASGLVALFLNAEITATEISEAFIKRYEDQEPWVHAWAYLDTDMILAQARALDKLSVTERQQKLLRAVPVGLKDIFQVLDMPSGMGSPVKSNFRPQHEGRVVMRLRDSGSVLFGKTATAEFAVHTAGETVNPHNFNHTPGTSSAGSAVAVATGMVPLALGSQTGGSTVRPASYCGVYGFKPSFGLVERSGMLRTAEALDTVSWFSRNIQDIELLNRVLPLRDKNNPIALNAMRSQKIPKKLSDITFGLVLSSAWNDFPQYALEALESFVEGVAKLGVSVKRIHLPAEFDDCIHQHSRLYDWSLAFHLKDEFDECKELFSDELIEIIDRGLSMPADSYGELINYQSKSTARLKELFVDCDYFLTLASGGEAPEGLNSRGVTDSCALWTLCGMPALSIPFAKGPLGLPFGIQLVGRKYHDDSLLRSASLLNESGLIGPVEAYDASSQMSQLCS